MGFAKQSILLVLGIFSCFVVSSVATVSCIHPEYSVAQIIDYSLVLIGVK